ncbi:hypothetical protein A4A49_15742 [Nicotiana attenuata]|uniref:Uncharacterized protein n=1 Tax=Nicotiana attenuata TaxID=49451 RepID=A0A314KZ78_NICAT|nr:hypothetical protein A4A49_15742 [Nicotiana attenuata]
MAVSKTPTRSHGAGGSGKPPPKKLPSDMTIAEKGDTERPPKIQQRVRQQRPSRLREVPLQIRVGASKPPPAKKWKVVEVKGKGKAKKVIDSESEHDSSDEEEAAILLHNGEGEPSVPGATAAVRGQRHVRHIGVQTDFEEPEDAELSALSATNGTATEEPTEVREVAIGNAAPTREGEMMAAIDTAGVALEDLSTLRTEVCY